MVHKQKTEITEVRFVYEQPRRLIYLQFDLKNIISRGLPCKRNLAEEHKFKVVMASKCDLNFSMLLDTNRFLLPNHEVGFFLTHTEFHLHQPALS